MSSKESKSRFPKTSSGQRAPSPKQAAVLKYGQRLRGLGSVSELIKHLKALGFHTEANMVKGACALLKSTASREYEEERKRLDPNFETRAERYYRECYENE